jgi:hypothetical protein
LLSAFSRPIHEAMYPAWRRSPSIENSAHRKAAHSSATYPDSPRACGVVQVDVLGLDKLKV